MKLPKSPVIKFAAWLLCVFLGFVPLLDYGARSGPLSSPALTWPQASALAKSDTTLRLVAFLHPKCPCSNATLSELALLLARNPQLQVQICFIKPAGATGDWEQTALCRRAATLPRATIRTDLNGLESAKFAAHTSGECFLYDKDDRLLFAGGITGSRGHEGENSSLSKLESLIQNRSAIKTISPTFGCPLSTPPLLSEANKKCLN